MDGDQIASVIMLTFDGLYTGIVLAFAVERINLWSRMPIEQYAVDFRRPVLRVDPLQPILASIAMLAAGYYAWVSVGSTRILAMVGLALLFVIFAGSVFIAEPVNSKFRNLPEGQVPDRTAQLRGRRQRFHLVRTGTAILALACLAVSVMV